MQTWHPGRGEVNFQYRLMVEGAEAYGDPPLPISGSEDPQ